MKQGHSVRDVLYHQVTTNVPNKGGKYRNGMVLSVNCNHSNARSRPDTTI